MKKLKEVIRYGLPETNSSSSHSVVISRLDKSNIDKEKYLSFLPNEDGVINIPKSDIDFGDRGFAASNDSMIKLQLVISLLAQKSDTIQEFGKRLFWLKRILCNFTGASDVIFDGLTEFNDIYKSYFNLEGGAESQGYTYIIKDSLSNAFNEVDHQSYYSLFREILDNKDCMLDFIFNTDSWLFLGNDSLDMNERIEKTLREYRSNKKISFGMSNAI